MPARPVILSALVLLPSLASAQQRAPAPAALTSAAAPATVTAELPRATVSTAYPIGGRVIRIPARANLQAAVDAARPGDVLVLAPGATYVGTLLLRNKGAIASNAPAGGWIVIRTDVPDAALGAEGTRMTPTRAESLKLARIQSPNYDPAVGTDPGAHHYRLTGVEISATPSVSQMNMLVRFGEGGDRQRTLASMPHHLIVDRSLVRGNARLDMKRCIALNSATSAIVDSWLADCHSKHGDSQAVLGYNGSGPYRIQNNHLEAAHEVVMFGGSDPGIRDLVPSDIELRGNHITRPVQWKGVWQVKNLVETKNARRLLVEGNVIENNWADAQVGFAFVIKSENQDNGAPWSTSSDITVRYNRIRNTGSVFNLSGAGSNPYKVVPASRIAIVHNVVEAVNVGPYKGDGIVFQFLGGLTDALIAHNTVLNQTSMSSTVVFDGAPAVRLVMHSNVFHNGQYGVHGDGTGSGNGALDRFAPAAVFRRNAIVGAPCNLYPATTVCPTSFNSIGFVSALRGDYRAAAGPLKGRGLNGGDIGADMDKVDAATKGAVVAP